MKNFGKFFYVLGIAVAIMAGMASLTKEQNTDVFGSIKCKDTTALNPTCPGNSNCIQKHWVPYGTSKPLTEYGYISGDQNKTCVSTGCTTIDMYLWNNTCTNVTE